ncbi:hypothetical protein JJB07_05440 [Tumebacillus sp. ITR2]|uniref:FeoB-associated Cys-rich membrane protein n=1 Tax=Tumebacillus amylolyticus TaxID=2801339 RepID=A0ABS1J798_9BACL|nr:hypothetical protein [Tumebacillus amylolyticus]MBL0386092.1 hypothetical protein [Tumebacillus amylolyticus]
MFGFLASLLFVVACALAVYFVYIPVTRCEACKEAGLLAGIEEETTTIA